jgi:hypothetical protein
VAKPAETPTYDPLSVKARIGLAILLIFLSVCAFTVVAAAMIGL